MTSKYKRTTIGEIPHEWKVTRLGDKNVADLIMGQSPPSSTYNKKKIGLPFLQGKAEFGEVYPSPEFYCSKPIKIAERNDVLISVRAPVGDVNIAPFKCCIGRGLSAIRPNTDKLHHRFLFYYLKFSKKRFESLSMGSTFKAIRKGEIENCKIPLPPIGEQRKIAQVLSDVDDAIQRVDEAIAKTERLKKGLMQELLTRGIGHKEFKQAPIGKIPKTWKVARLGEVADFKNGINFNKEQKGDKGILTVDVLNMYGESIYLDLANLYRVNISLKKDYFLQRGDILFVRSSLKKEGAGWACLFNGWNEPVTFCGFIIRARVKNQDISAEFLTYFLRSHIVRKGLIAGSGQVAITNITQELLKTLKFPLPPLEEQQKIVEILSAVDYKLDLDRKRKGKLERIKKGLMNDLLTGKKRVKV
jgi:type I restriction enzyme S subunit